MATTVADIARHVSVSTSTAADILRGRKGYSPKTCKRVMDAAKELDFVPNMMAKSLLTRKSHIIGVVGSVLDIPPSVEMHKGISQTLIASGYMPLFVDTSAHQHGMDQAMIDLRGRAVDGLILRSNFDDQEIARLAPRGTPWVAIRSKDSSENGPYVVNDRFNVMADCVRYLAERGHQKIGFMGFDNNLELLGEFNSHRLKIEGYCEGMARQGLSDNTHVIEVDYETSPIGAVRIFAERNIELLSSFTAIIASNDQIAIELITGLASKGLSVPGDCSIVGFDDTTFALAINPRLTSYQPHRTEVGTTAARMILDLIEGREVASTTITPELIERESVRSL